MTARGFLFLFTGAAIIAFWFYLYVTHTVPTLAAIGLILISWLLGTWLLPVLTPMRLRR
jgi:hypothetical protein